MTDLKNAAPKAPVADFDFDDIDALVDPASPMGSGSGSGSGSESTTSGRGKTVKPKSTPLRRVLKALIALVGTVLIVLLSVIGYAWYRIEQIPKVAIPKDPGVPAAGPLPTIEIPLDGGTADGGPVVENTLEFNAGNPVDSTDGSSSANPTTTKASGKATTQDSIPDPGEGDLNTPIATVKPLPGKTEYGALLDTSGVAALGGSGAKNYLMIGVDSRADIPDDQTAAFGKVSGSRSDTIMLLRLDPSSKQAWVLSFPRDLYVRIAGTNQFNRLNAAYAKSAGVLTSTIRENFNVPVDHFAVIDFVGFQKVVDAVGGVNICFPKASRDIKTGLNQPAGCNLLDPKQATAYVRSRRFQEGENGVWREDPRGDLGRIQRQQAFIRATLSQAVKEGMSDPVVFNALLTSLKDAITLDQAFGFGDIAKLAADLRSFDPNTLETFTVPVTPKRIAGKEVEIIDKAKGRKVVGQFGQRKVADK